LSEKGDIQVVAVERFY